jgi:serine/threonine-protein kinase RsbW
VEAARLDSHEGATISLTVPAKPEYVIVCRLALDGLADAETVTAEVLSDLKLAVTEACANSIAHAYPAEEVGPIRVDVLLEPERVVIEVADEGIGIENPEIGTFEREPDLGEETREGGMGLALISALVDDLQVGRGRDGRGTRVAFSKSLG